MQVNQEGTANIEDARCGRSDQKLEDQWNSNMLGDRSLVIIPLIWEKCTPPLHAEPIRILLSKQPQL